MKNKLIYIFFLILFLFCGCNKTASNIDNYKEPIYLKFFLPGKNKYLDSQTVFSSVNNIVNSKLSNDIIVDFNIINKYEYMEKLKLYLSAGEQIDLAWANDNDMPYITEINKNNFKILNDYIDKYGSAIKNSFSKDTWENIMVGNRIYYIPSICETNGMIPYIKIPKKLSNYIDINALKESFLKNPTITNESMKILDQYLKILSSEGLLYNGVDPISLKRTLPYKGYETLLSTHNLFGYKIKDETYQIVNLLDTPETKLVEQYLYSWYQKGYIRQDINLVDKNNLDASNEYILSAIWGYVNKDGLQSILDDDVTNDYIYCPLDNTYHLTKMITESIVFIPKNSNHPIETIKVLNLMFQNKELYKLITYGIKDKHYTEANNSQITIIEPTRYSMYPNILPHGPSNNFIVNKENIFDVTYQKVNSPLLTFQPSMSSANKNLIDFLNKNREKIDNLIWIDDNYPRIEIDEILKDLQKQVNDFLAKQYNQ